LLQHILLLDISYHFSQLIIYHQPGWLAQARMLDRWNGQPMNLEERDGQWRREKFHSKSKREKLVVWADEK